MGDDVKKISFGFSKLAKKTTIVTSQLNKPKPQESAVEFIDCLEGKSIKLKEPVKTENTILVIPLKRKSESDNYKTKQEPNTSGIEPNGNLADKQSNTNDDQYDPIVNSLPTLNKDEETKTELLTLDEIAAKEILEDLNKKTKEEARVFSVPLTSNAPVGEKESSIEDYENIPVDAFGMAMLRGMGWAPGKGIGKNEKIANPTMPTLRPKGMGLGADKVIKTATSENKTNSEDLKMVKGSHIRIIAGIHKDAYGQIEGFDDESGRLIVKLALKNTTISLNEFMVQLVDKSDFIKNSKVINVGKYEQYKDKEKQSEELSEKLTTGKTKQPNKQFDDRDRSYSKARDRDYKKSTSPDSRHQNKGRIFKRELKEESHRNRNRKSRSRSNSSDDRPNNSSTKRSKSTSKNRISDRNPSHNKNLYKNEKQRERSISRSSSISSRKSSSSSNDSGLKYKSRTKKKKPSSHKYKSRSRSRSPKKHKSHKKHKRSKC